MSSIARMRAAQSARERAESPKRVSFDDGTRGGGGAATARAASPGRSASPAMSTAGMTAGSRQRAAPVRSSRERMAELSELLSADLITKEEFDMKRKAILDSI